MKAIWHYFLEAAALAPSGDNTQPWRFSLDEDANRMTIDLDETRDPSPMNSNQRMSRIALGAATENVLAAAAEIGSDLETSWDGLGRQVSFELLTPSPALAAAPVDAVRNRVTNRRFYDGRPLTPEVLAGLRDSTPALGSTRTVWIADRAEIERAATVIASADERMFAQDAMRVAFFKNIRFDRPANEEVRWGLSLGSLELGYLDRASLRFLARLSADWVRRLGAPKKFAAHTLKLVQSASAICFILADDDEPVTDIAVGRTLIRAWLAATRFSLAAQPMMSFPVLDNAVSHGGEFWRMLEPEIGNLREGFRSISPLESGRIAAILRVGFAPQPTSRTGRLAIEDSMAVMRPADKLAGTSA